jgi:hypothetical protein
VSPVLIPDGGSNSTTDNSESNAKILQTKTESNAKILQTKTE